MKRKKKENPILYKKYLQNHQEMEEIQEIKEMVGEKSDAIVVQKISMAGKLLQLISDVLLFLLRTAAIAVIVSLIALGVTVLLNPNLRNILIETVNNFLTKGTGAL